MSVIVDVTAQCAWYLGLLAHSAVITTVATAGLMQENSGIKLGILGLSCSIVDELFHESLQIPSIDIQGDTTTGSVEKKEQKYCLILTFYPFLRNQRFRIQNFHRPCSIWVTVKRLCFRKVFIGCPICCCTL